MIGTFTCLHYPARARAAPRALAVMLPGAGIEAADFATNGMIAEMHDRGLPVDIIAAKPEMDLYLDGDIATVLHRAVIEVAIGAGYAKVWLLGISLGGMGALLHASAYATQLEGMFLLAPFLGTQGTIAAIEASGGLAAWSPGPGTTNAETRMLQWLQNRPASLQLYLGYGQADRFARGHRLLAETLPTSRVFTNSGGHDWGTWRALWRQMLDTTPFIGAA